MILTIAQYRTITGDSTTLDADLQVALDIYTSVIESYCNRTFGASSYSEKYYDVKADPLVLNNHLVRTVDSITIGTEAEDVDELQIHKGLGFLYHDQAWYDQDVTVVYTAGADAPYLVKHVLATTVAGYLAGDTGGSQALRPTIKETVYGVAATQYGGVAADAEDGMHPELGAFTTMLDRYTVPVLA